MLLLWETSIHVPWLNIELGVPAESTYNILYFTTSPLLNELEYYMVQSASCFPYMDSWKDFPCQETYFATTQSLLAYVSVINNKALFGRGTQCCGISNTVINLVPWYHALR